LEELVGAFGLEYEIVFVEMVEADKWGVLDGKSRDFMRC
jgi:hypothetical protein